MIGKNAVGSTWHGCKFACVGEQKGRGASNLAGESEVIGDKAI